MIFHYLYRIRNLHGLTGTVFLKYFITLLCQFSKAIVFRIREFIGLGVGVGANAMLRYAVRFITFVLDVLKILLSYLYFSSNCDHLSKSPIISFINHCFCIWICCFQYFSILITLFGSDKLK